MNDPLAAIPLVQSPDKATSILWLLGSLGLIVGSFMLKPGDDRQVVIRGFDLVLPETCAAYRVFGVNCPGCGLTRSFVAISEGRLSDAWQLNPAGFFIYLFLLTQIPLAGYYWVQNSKGKSKSKTLKRLLSWNQMAFFALLLCMICQWIVRSFV